MLFPGQPFHIRDTGAPEGSNAKKIEGFELTWEDIAAFPGGLLEEVQLAARCNGERGQSVLFLFLLIAAT